MDATKLELLCEQWWREHGCDVKIVNRELVGTIYDVDGERYEVPLLVVGWPDWFRERFILYWEGKRNDTGAAADVD